MTARYKVFKQEQHRFHAGSANHRRHKPRRGLAILSLGVCAVLLAFLLFGVGKNDLPLAVPLACAVTSALSFLLYGIDKHRARLNKRRVPELHLQLLSLLGGWPGALLAQQMFRHKTRKRSFLLVFWMVILINISLIALASLHAADAWSLLREPSLTL